MGSRNHLVVVVPGIGGSVLQRQNGDTVWAAKDRNIWDLLMHPGEMGLDDPDLLPAGLIHDPQLMPGITLMAGYNRLWSRLEKLPGADVDAGLPGRRVDDANIVAFGYDFRRSIVDAADRLGADVEKRLEALGWSGQHRRVVVVAHSMGGLVARHWLGRSDPDLSAGVVVRAVS